jgi:hypothetical protein
VNVRHRSSAAHVGARCLLCDNTNGVTTSHPAAGEA